MSTLPLHATRCAAALSIDEDPDAAIDRLAGELSDRLDGADPSLLTLFVSSQHADHAESIARSIRDAVEADTLIGVTSDAVLAGPVEAEQRPALAAWTLDLPGLDVHAFSASDLPTRPEEDLDALAGALALDERARAILLFVDPFSAPLVKLLPALNAAAALANPAAPAPIVGAMASGADTAGGNRLLLDTRAHTMGLVGVTLRERDVGAMRVDTVVSQGCRPVGPDLVITKARGNAIQQLAGRNALTVVQEILEALPEDDRQLLRKGLFLGRVVNEYKERFGRGDYLIRPVVGAEPNSGTLAIGDVIKIGQTVRLHIRDATTATEDLALLLDGQKLHGPPAGALLFTANARGAGLFDKPNHDASAIIRAFAPPEAGERLAKAGKPYAETSTVMPGRHVPLAGCYAAGELGPIGGQSFLHGHTASMVLFR